MIFGTDKISDILREKIYYISSENQPETRKLQQVSYHQADIRMRSHRLLRLGIYHKEFITVKSRLIELCPRL